MYVYMHIYIKVQPTAIYTLPVIAKYVPETTMTPKLCIYVIYAKHLMCIHGTCSQRTY